MTASINSSPVHREQDLLGQTVLVIGGSSGIGLETARLARAQGASIILTARDPDRLHRVGLELGASIAAFDATDFGRLGRFFDALPAPIASASASWYRWPLVRSSSLPALPPSASSTAATAAAHSAVRSPCRTPAPPMVVASFTSRSANSRPRS